MSSIAKVLIGALVSIIAIAVLIALVAVAIGWLLPVATLGAFAPGFVPCVAIVALLAIVRGVTINTK